ncbi:MAG TPA: phosphoenolpyruvate carboxykinase (ATP) [Chryseolinea sp.]
MAQSLNFLPEDDIRSFIRAKTVHYQLSAQNLIRQTIENNQGVLSDTGALVVSTGEFTGRSPKDKFIVRDSSTDGNVHWNQFNIPIEEKYFDSLYRKVCMYLQNRPIWVRDCLACAHPGYTVPITVVTETPWANLFCYNMFLRPEESPAKQNSESKWTIIQAPGFFANPVTDGTRQHNFSIINFAKRIILIGGTAYTGEIKKGVFTVLNYLLPLNHGILSMHCSANTGPDNDTAIYFGLSGTGKTTLSTDVERKLIGDDEHGWDSSAVFNFEGGCYAKCINLTIDKEPGIFKAIRTGALLENVTFFPHTSTVDYENTTITENSRVSYPIHFIDNITVPSMGEVPKNIFFLTCDATGIFPPVARLTPQQSMYYFISGYTAKIAGTEAGIVEPQSTFSACFGAPFLPLHPFYYAKMLGKKIKENDVKVWLINTGWTGGPYGIGKRIPLSLTRAMIKSALKGKLDHVDTEVHPVFDFAMPATCPEVPSEILNPRNTWNDKSRYDEKARQLALEFKANFEKYVSGTDADVAAAGPKT